MARTLPTPAAPAQDETRGVLAIKPFRKFILNNKEYSLVKAKESFPM